MGVTLDPFNVFFYFLAGCHNLVAALAAADLKIHADP
jgi:hypothetical protein